MNRNIHPLNSQVVTQGPLQTLGTDRRYAKDAQDQMIQQHSGQSPPSGEISKVGRQHHPHSLFHWREKCQNHICTLRSYPWPLCGGRARREAMQRVLLGPWPVHSRLSPLRTRTKAWDPPSSGWQRAQRHTAKCGGVLAPDSSHQAMMGGEWVDNSGGSSVLSPRTSQGQRSQGSAELDGSRCIGFFCFPHSLTQLPGSPGVASQIISTQIQVTGSVSGGIQTKTIQYLSVEIGHGTWTKGAEVGVRGGDAMSNIYPEG